MTCVARQYRRPVSSRRLRLHEGVGDLPVTVWTSWLLPFFAQAFGDATAGNDGFEDDDFLALDEWNQMGVFAAPHHKDPLTGVAFGARMFEDFDQVADGDMENDLLETNPSFEAQPGVLFAIPNELLHGNCSDDIVHPSGRYEEQHLATCGARREGIASQA